MSVWTCTACSARYSVGAPCCPQCGATSYEDGDTISGPEGVQGARHEAQPYAQPVHVTPPVEAAPVAAQAPAEPTETPGAQP